MIDYRKDNIWTVYVHIVPKNITNLNHDMYYVGLTKQNVKRRWGYSTGIHYKKSTVFYNAIEQYGFQNMIHEIVAEHLTKDEAYNLEELLISKLKSNNPEYGYNMTAGRGHLNYSSIKNIIEYDPSKKINDDIPIPKETENSLFFIKNNNKNFEEMEIWKPVVGYEEFYQVSNFGRVRSLDRYVPHSKDENSLYLKKGKILSERDNGHGYKAVHLTVKRITKDKYVHRLVAEAFLPNPNNLPEVNHKDENPANNCLDNVEWCTSQYNDLYGNHRRNLSKPVIMYDLQMNYIDEFKSDLYAERQTGARGVLAVCQGKRHTAGGYIWRYKQEINQSEKED